MENALAALDPLLTLALPWLYALFLALARVGGVFMALPQFTRRTIPTEVKGLVPIAFASALVWLRPPPALPASGLEFTIALTLMMEMLFGLAMGFVIHVMVSTVRLAGQLAGIEMGLSFAAIADPLNQAQGTVISVFFSQIALQLFLALGFDRIALGALAESVKIHPLGSGQLHTDALMAITSMGDAMFRVGVSLALPITGALFALKLSMALLARVAPRIQIFVLTFTLTLLVGQIILAIAFPAIAGAIGNHLEETMLQFRQVAVG